MNTSSTNRSQHLAMRQRQLAELVRCYRRELASWQAQLLRHSALMLIERTRRDWKLDRGGST